MSILANNSLIVLFLPSPYGTLMMYIYCKLSRYYYRHFTDEETKAQRNCDSFNTFTLNRRAQALRSFYFTSAQEAMYLWKLNATQTSLKQAYPAVNIFLHLSGGPARCSHTGHPLTLEAGKPGILSPLMSMWPWTRNPLKLGFFICQTGITILTTKRYPAA